MKLKLNKKYEINSNFKIELSVFSIAKDIPSRIYKIRQNERYVKLIRYEALNLYNLLKREFEDETEIKTK